MMKLAHNYCSSGGLWKHWKNLPFFNSFNWPSNLHWSFIPYQDWLLTLLLPPNLFYQSICIKSVDSNLVEFRNVCEQLRCYSWRCNSNSNLALSSNCCVNCIDSMIYNVTVWDHIINTKSIYSSYYIWSLWYKINLYYMT